MKLSYFLTISLELSVQYQLVFTSSQNSGALSESFVINLKAIKSECEANTANVLAVIYDLQQNQNLSLVKTLKEETQSLKKLVEEQQQISDQLNRTVQEQQSTIEDLKESVNDQHQMIGE